MTKQILEATKKMKWFLYILELDLQNQTYRRTVHNVKINSKKKSLACFPQYYFL